VENIIIRVLKNVDATLNDLIFFTIFP
jgi:hypothetical protein